MIKNFESLWYQWCCVLSTCYNLLILVVYFEPVCANFYVVETKVIDIFL